MGSDSSRVEEKTRPDGSTTDDLLREIARVDDVPLGAERDLLGARLAHFHVVALLGHGGMGIVYRAEDEVLRREVALKVLPPRFAEDEERRRRLLREARSAAAVSHPNIATVYEVGEAEGRVYIAMELVRGQSLAAMLAARRLQVPEAIRIALQILNGLGKAHEAGLVHRDLKPDNVMITDDGAVKVLDFGLAKPQEQISSKSEIGQAETVTKVTAEGRILGTPSYMSPEQARGTTVDHRSDVFSFGVMLYEMLTGQRPFAGTTAADVLTAILRDDPAPISKLNADVPAALSRIVERCLAKEPGGRYDDCGGLASDLERALEPGAGRALPAPPSPLAKAVAAPAGARRSRRWFTIVVLVAAGAAIGVLQGKVHLSPRPAPSAEAPPPLVIDALGCEAAALTGSDPSPDLASAIGIGACARLGTDLGVSWSAKSAAHTLSVKADLRPDGAAAVTLTLGGREARGEGRTPIAAVDIAVGALEAQVSGPPVTPQEIKDWGAKDAASAWQIRRMWRRSFLLFLADERAVVKRIIEADPESPWPHALMMTDVVQGTEEYKAELEKALRLSDKLPPGRAHGLRGRLLLMSAAIEDQQESSREGKRLLREGHSELPDDPEIISLYALGFCEYGDGWAAKVERAYARSPIQSLPMLFCDIDRQSGDQKLGTSSLDRLLGTLPESAAWPVAIASLIQRDHLEEARAALRFRRRLGMGDGMGDDEMNGAALIMDGYLHLRALLPEAALAFGERFQGDPRRSVTGLGATLIIHAHLMAGRVVDAESTLIGEIDRQRRAGNTGAAEEHLIMEMHLRRWLHRPVPEADRFTWLEKRTVEMPKSDIELICRAWLLLARTGGAPEREVARKALSTYEEQTDRVTQGNQAKREWALVYSVPLVRVARGDAAAVKRWRETTHAPGNARDEMAFDAALALEAEGQRKEAEEAYLTTSKRIPAGCFAAIAARVRLAEIYRATGRKDEAAALDAIVDKVWAKADPGLRDTVHRMK